MLRPLLLGVWLVLSSIPAGAQTLRTLHALQAAEDGSSTSTPLVQAGDGLFYGVNRFDGVFGLGTLFRMTPNGTLTVIHAFTGGADGARPGGALLQGLDGSLYGMTAEGGVYNRGVLFRMTLAGDFSVVHAFGATPEAGRVPSSLIQSAAGDFYGTTCSGGENDRGTVFRMTAGDVTTLYSFVDGAGGRCPFGLLIATDGMFYGTAAGGALGDGIAFRLTPEGVFTNIHEYVRGIEGGAPGPLLQSRIDGLFYGVATSTRGPFDFTSGSVYRMTTTGSLQVMHAFGSTQYGGVYPIGRLVEGTDGNFYGVTENGGLPYSYFTTTGTIFRVTRSGTHTVLRLLRADFDGMNPTTGLMQAADGHLYGAAAYGGFYGAGTIFRLETYLCTATVDAIYTPQFQSLNLLFRFQSSAPGTWSMWAFSSAGLTPMWSVPVGAISLPVGFSTGFTLAPAGPILFITRLDVPGFGSCGGVSLVDTGSATARTSTR
jgi:uncharacterized repeat protein (TIGR03803 family)